MSKMGRSLMTLLLLLPLTAGCTEQQQQPQPPAAEYTLDALQDQFTKTTGLANMTSAFDQAVYDWVLIEVVTSEDTKLQGSFDFWRLGYEQDPTRAAVGQCAFVFQNSLKQAWIAYRDESGILLGPAEARQNHPLDAATTHFLNLQTTAKAFTSNLVLFGANSTGEDVQLKYSLEATSDGKTHDFYWRILRSGHADCITGLDDLNGEFSQAGPVVVARNMDRGWVATEGSTMWLYAGSTLRHEVLVLNQTGELVSLEESGRPGPLTVQNATLFLERGSYRLSVPYMEGLHPTVPIVLAALVVPCDEWTSRYGQ